MDWNNYWKNYDQKEVLRHQAALDMIHNGTALDLACGDGLFLSKLREKGIQGVGLDISEEAVGKAKENGLDARVFDFSKNALPFPDSSFGTAVILDSLQYFNDPFWVLQEMRRVAKNFIVVQSPNFSSLPSRWQMLLGKVPENNRPKRAGIYWFSWPILKAMLEKSGFAVEETRVNSFFNRFPGLKQLMLLMAKIRPSVFALQFIIKARKI